MGGGFHIFTLGGIPVFVSLWYALMIFFLASRTGNMQVTVLWIVAITVSILVHEFGHALVARHFRLSPKILLHGWGGLCSHDRSDRDLHDALIVMAGPGIGLVLGGIVFIIELVLMVFFRQQVTAIPYLHTFLGFMIYVNLFWSLVNLLPFWPLDGGQLFRLGMLRIFESPRRAERITHIVGTAVGVPAVILAFTSGYMFFGVIAVLLTWQNISRINETSASGPIRRKNKFAHSLTADATKALERGDYTEAARLCHQVRAETNIDQRTLDEIWRILAVSAVEMGEYEEAKSYLRRAPKSPEVFRAKVKYVIARDERSEAAQLLEEPEAKKLPLEARRALEQMLS